MNLPAYKAYMPYLYRIILCYILPCVTLCIALCIMLGFPVVGSDSTSGINDSAIYVMYSFVLILIAIAHVLTSVIGDRDAYFGAYRKDHVYYDYMKTSRTGRKTYYEIARTDLLMGILTALLPAVIVAVITCITQYLFHYPIADLFYNSPRDFYIDMSPLTAYVKMLLLYLCIMFNASLAELLAKLVLRHIVYATAYTFTLSLIFSEQLSLNIVLVSTAWNTSIQGTSGILHPWVWYIVIIGIQIALMILLIILNLRRTRKLLDLNWLRD